MFIKGPGRFGGQTSLSLGLEDGNARAGERQLENKHSYSVWVTERKTFIKGVIKIQRCQMPLASFTRGIECEGFRFRALNNWDFHFQF